MVRSLVGERGWTALRRARKKCRRLLRRPVGNHRRDDLQELAIRFGTDKWGSHRYTPHYQRHLGHLRNSKIRLLEIGIGGYSAADRGGGSLRMWKSFFRNGQITGLDLHDKSFVNEPRIRAFKGDQTDVELLQKINSLAGPFDVIIDDGSHRSEHIVATFRVLFPLLANHGVYVVEDTQTSYWPEWGGSDSLTSDATSMAFFKRMVDGLNWEEFVDDDYEPTYSDQFVRGLHFYHNLVFVEKGRNREGTRKKKILRERYQPRT